MLCINLSKDNKVFCYVPDFGLEEFEDAKKNKVILVKPRKIPSWDPYYSMNSMPVLPDGSGIDLIIGHDRITGPIMAALHQNFYQTSKTILFIHTAPGEIEIFKPEQINEDHAAKAEERENEQKDLAKISSLVVTVGPKLYGEFKTSMSGGSAKPPILEFNPGLYFSPTDIDYTFDSIIPEAFMMGRIEDFHLKGVDIAFIAMDNVLSEWNESLNGITVKPRFVIRGCPVGTDRHLREKLNEHVSNTKLITIIRNYNEKIEVINEDIRRSYVLLMPSRTEGFGLVALEAISLGRPILIGENTGLASLLKKIAPDEARHWIVPDLHWAEYIRSIFKDRKAAAERLKKLVDEYAKQVSWESSVSSLMANINLVPLGILFSSNAVQVDAFDFHSRPIWDNEKGKHIGPSSEADFSFSNKVITVNRKNGEGRNIINIIKYNSKNTTTNFIQKTGDGSQERKIKIVHEAKNIGLPIQLFIIIHKKGDNGWYQYSMSEVIDSEWKEFVFITSIADNLDFTIQLQEKNFKGINGEYQIRNFQILEM